MNERMKAIRASKQAERRRLAGLPISEKVAILEKMRDRSRAIADTTLYQKRSPHGRKVSVLRERRETAKKFRVKP